MPSQRLELLFYGDSILESFRGTSRGGPCPRCARGPEVYQQHFGSKYNCTVLAISGALVQLTRRHVRSRSGTSQSSMSLRLGCGVGAAISAEYSQPDRSCQKRHSRRQDSHRVFAYRY